MTHLLLALALIQPASTGDPLVAGKTYDLPKHGRFDVLAWDDKFHRVLAAHSEAGTLAVLETTTGKLSEVETGPINGVAISARLNRIYVAGGNEKLTAIDRDNLKVIGSVDLGGQADTIAVDSKRGHVFVGHDDGTELWVVDGSTLKKLGTVTIEEAPEFVVYNAALDRIFQNIKSTDHLQVIDPGTMKVVATWGSGDMKSPHGLVVDGRASRAYSVGRNGKLVQYDLESGKILATIDVTQGVDELGIDTGNHRVYCPGGGKLTVVDISGPSPKSMGDVTIPKGAHTLTVDGSTHDVWLAYGDKTSAHFAQFVAK